VAAEGRSLTELRSVGPWVGRLLHLWFEDPPEVPEVPATRAGFMSLAEARAAIGDDDSWRRELRADLQMHTVYSDGSETVSEVAAHCAERGYEYIAITDHSKGLPIAGGIDEATLAGQMDEIERVNADLDGLTILRALEMNIGVDGSGDMDPEALKQLDLVVGSFHSQLRKTEDQTERYLAALENPFVHIVGHPRGRMYNRRRGLDADWKVVFETAAALGKAMEINAQPARQDLQVELLEIARDTEVLFSIGTDAHYESELDNVEFSLGAAAKVGIPKERIVNFWPLDRFRAWVGELQGRP
jgi:histidinol phosphatase-like PHP family hydrolase